MDFGTIKKKIDSGAYKKPEQFASDVRLIFSNCIRYHFILLIFYFLFCP